jgi:murein DD-endopeptidase MepM/ murein hydrolase activator NlpD
MHRSIDIPLPIGTPILALDHGIVARVQRQERDIAGIWVGLTHPSGISSLYVHLSRIDVERGQRVERGQVVGLSGDTGNARGKPHLHLNLRASPALLPSIEAAIGRPPFGWGPPRRVFGHAIPAEPFVPVDGHRARVKRAAAIGGIPLYRGPITLRPSRQEESP